MYIYMKKVTDQAAEERIWEVPSMNRILSIQHHSYNLQLESTGMRATDAASRAASGSLEPADELLNGEGLREG